MGSRAHGTKLEPHGENELAASHNPLAPVLNAAGPLRSAQLHVEVGMTADLADDDFDAQREMTSVLDREALEVRKQRREALRIGQEVKHLLCCAAGEKRSRLIHDEDRLVHSRCALDSAYRIRPTPPPLQFARSSRV